MTTENLRKSLENGNTKDDAQVELENMLSEAQRKAKSMIEAKYPKIVAHEFVVNLPVGMQLPDNALFSGETINRVTIRRMNRLERRQGNIKVASGRIDKEDVALDKMDMLITKISSVDDSGTMTASYEWENCPRKDRLNLLNSLDMIDEDEILEGMTALEFGFGTIEDFYASTAFEELKKRQEESFL